VEAQVRERFNLTNDVKKKVEESKKKVEESKKKVEE